MAYYEREFWNSRKDMSFCQWEDYTEIEKKIGKIVQDREGCLFKQFIAVYLISPLTSNKKLAPTSCFWGKGTMGHKVLSWSMALMLPAPSQGIGLQNHWTFGSPLHHTQEESASFTSCCRCGSSRMAPGDPAVTGKAGGTLAWPDSSSYFSPPPNIYPASVFSVVLYPFLRLQCLFGKASCMLTKDSCRF